ncbi:hypothetical protein EPUS_02216 [Endocarpon pusillum Z07020]|uniref:Uncharacterized protein n=1 Tax=Endocarpon pusillum (strain Z07020 / HMAS-L-300199) TaxID=1263415 RepID=U1GG92_ENDPU|nr:uncharacterized protein EPUS_02216 [Endocarpon pusillum Z07020]ERF76677.1 hypothetical protein EPUS_02216 [Endocarpon pusillum Z07020]
MVLNIKTALDECAEHVTDIQHRNNTLIDYYIYPKPVPTAIAAYQPRLATLQQRIKLIKKVNFSQLEQLVNDPDGYAALHLRSIIAELLNAILGFQSLFEKHYDPSLPQQVRYVQAFNGLKFIDQHLHELISKRQSKHNHPRAEHLLAHHSYGSSYQFCRGAIQVLNEGDQGLIANVSDNDLLPSNRYTLASKGGAYLWWTCSSPSCAFRLRFHVLGSQESSIHHNLETRTHPCVNLEYRSIFLVKSHLHISSYDCVGVIKYGCLFCFAEGRPLQGEVTAFSTGRALATHLSVSHRSGNLPPAMLLEKFKVAVGGQCPMGVSRWDANILRN